jgi:hypothetical protein
MRLKIVSIVDIDDECRAKQLMSEHLSAQGSPDPKGGLHCFCCPNEI